VIFDNFFLAFQLAGGQGCSGYIKRPFNNTAMKHTIHSTILACALILSGALLPLAAQPVISNAADLPTANFPLEVPPSEIIFGNDPSYLDELKTALKADILGILEGYVLEDVATERSMRQVLRAIAMVDGDWDEVLAQTSLVQELENKPAARAVAGFLANNYALAAMDVGTDEGPVFLEAFRARFETAIAAMDLELVQDTLQSTKGTFEIISEDIMRGSVSGALDPNAEAQDMDVTRSFAGSIIQIEQTLLYLPIKEIVVEVISEALATIEDDKVDLWTPRLVSFEDRTDLTPVVVGNWDSGVDPEVFADRLWTNPNEVRDGTDTDGNGFVDDIHGIAFDTDYLPYTGALRPMPESDVAQIDSLLVLIKGAMDLRAAVDSEAAQAFRRTMSSLTPEQIAPFQLQLGRLGLYMHGTTTGYTSVEDNPAARIVYSRFDQEVTIIPEAMDEAMAENFASHVRHSVDYFQAAGARVVNMSWRITLPQIEGTLSAVEPDPEIRRERAERVFATINDALVEAFSGAPEILFIAGAGNEDEDVEFVESFPAGSNLDNVLTVGAVDISLEPASFTSYGGSIDLYANGFEVPSVVPGGSPINISGTSLAAPQVANLAAKLFAVDPTLTVEEVRALIMETATTDGSNELPVIHPQVAIGLLENR